LIAGRGSREESFLNTSTVTRLHGRPQDPVDPKISKIGEIHVPISLGLVMEMWGRIGRAGEVIRIVCEGEEGNATHS
jgi:hypothetical protein